MTKTEQKIVNGAADKLERAIRGEGVSAEVAAAAKVMKLWLETWVIPPLRTAADPDADQYMKQVAARV